MCCFDGLYFHPDYPKAIRGASIPPVLTNLHYLQNVILLGKSRSIYTLSHEISHILLNATHDSQYFEPDTNIFHKKASNQAANILDCVSDNYFDDMGRGLHPMCQINQKSVMRSYAKKLHV